MPDAPKQGTRFNHAKKLSNGNGRAAASLRSKSPRPQKAVYFASIFPRPSFGEPIDPKFVQLVRRLEREIRIPIWLMVQNGHKSFCCQSICSHALRGFQSNRELIPEGRPAALLLDSPGGDAHYAYTIARFFQRRTSQFMAIVPRFAKSAATLLALGASRLMLGQDAELGPLDVQMRDSEREEIGSALDAVQSLERLNVFSMTAIDQLLFLMAERTGKKIEFLTPQVLNYASAFVRPLLEKIDTVEYTKKSRELKVAEEYAVRLMRQNYPIETAKKIAAHLVEKYPTHGFIIDRDEARAKTIAGESYGVGLHIETPSRNVEKIFQEMQPFLDSLSVMGTLVQVGA